MGMYTEIILDVIVVSKLLILPVTKKLFKIVFINLHIIKYAYIKKDIIIDTLFCSIIFFVETKIKFNHYERKNFCYFSYISFIL